MTYAQQMPGLLQKGKADTQDCKAWVDEQLSEMSLKEKDRTTVYTHSGSSSDTAKIKKQYIIQMNFVKQFNA